MQVVAPVPFTQVVAPAPITQVIVVNKDSPETPRDEQSLSMVDIGKIVGGVFLAATATLFLGRAIGQLGRTWSVQSLAAGGDTLAQTGELGLRVVTLPFYAAYQAVNWVVVTAALPVASYLNSNVITPLWNLSSSTVQTVATIFYNNILQPGAQLAVWAANNLTSSVIVPLWQASCAGMVVLAQQANAYGNYLVQLSANTYNWVWASLVSLNQQALPLNYSSTDIGCYTGS